MSHFLGVLPFEFPSEHKSRHQVYVLQLERTAAFQIHRASELYNVFRRTTPPSASEGNLGVRRSVPSGEGGHGRADEAFLPSS
jgi:hypothetical protein